MPRVHETIPYIFYISFDENFFIQYVYATYLCAIFVQYCSPIVEESEEI